MKTDRETSRKTRDRKPAADAPAGKPDKRISRRFAAVVCLLLVLAMCIFWLIDGYSTRNLLRQQADSLGQSLARQTASQLTESMLTNDLISMNVVLDELVRDAAVAEATVVNVNNEVMAAATGVNAAIRPLVPLPLSPGSLEIIYSAPIPLADSIAGFVHLRLDLSHIEAGALSNLALLAGATGLLLIVAAALTTAYYQYLVSFPANLLSFALSNIRKGEIETCPEPADRNELSTAIRQFNATAEFLAQNTFLDSYGPDQAAGIEPDAAGMPEATLLVIRMSNFQYLASTVNEKHLTRLLNKYYFYAGKLSRLYNGVVSYCADDEVVICFSTARLPEEQAFHAVCAAQLFLLMVADINNIDNATIDARFKLAVHSGANLRRLYSPISRNTDNLMGKALDLTRVICRDCPDNAVLISESAFQQAGGARIEAEEYSISGEREQLRTYIALEPMTEYRLLLQRQATRLAGLFND